MNRLAVVATGLLFSAILGGQESKPGKPAPRTFEHKIGTVSIALSPPPAWEVTKTAKPAQYLSAPLPWNLVEVWRCTEHEELTIRMFAVQQPGIKAKTVADAWFDQAKATARENVIVRADVSSRSDKTVRGRDIEADFSRGVTDQVTTYVWLRALNLSKDHVVVLYAEDCPVKSDKFGWAHLVESHVEEIRAVLDSFRSDAKRKEESWRRGPEVEIVWRYSVGVTITGPAEWDFSRQGWSGGVVWRDPRKSGRDYLVAIDLGKAERTLDAARMMVQATNGEMIADQALDGPGHGRELVSVSHFEGAVLWHRRRVWQCREDRSAFSIQLVATVQLADAESGPSLEVRREADALFNGMRVSCDAW